MGGPEGGSARFRRGDEGGHGLPGAGFVGTGARAGGHRPRAGADGGRGALFAGRRAGGEPKVINLFVEPAAAGIAVPAMGRDYEPYELAPEDPQGAAYAVRVQGDSMAPDFPDGSIVFVNHDAMQDGDIGIFSVDEGMVCRQYYKDPFGFVYLFHMRPKPTCADYLIRRDGAQKFICHGRVIAKKRYPVPGR